MIMKMKAVMVDIGIFNMNLWSVIDCNTSFTEDERRNQVVAKGWNIKSIADNKKVSLV